MIDESRLLNAAKRAYAEATGHDAGAPSDEVLQRIKEAIKESLGEEVTSS